MVIADVKTVQIVQVREGVSRYRAHIVVAYIPENTKIHKLIITLKHLCNILLFFKAVKMKIFM